MRVTFHILLHGSVRSHCIGDITPLATDPLCQQHQQTHFLCYLKLFKCVTLISGARAAVTSLHDLNRCSEIGPSVSIDGQPSVPSGISFSKRHWDLYGTEEKYVASCHVEDRSVSPVVTICTASLTFSNSMFWPHSVFMCFVWIWEQTAIISLYSINWLVFITEIWPFTAQWSLYVPPV